MWCFVVYIEREAARIIALISERRGLNEAQAAFETARTYGTTKLMTEFEKCASHVGEPPATGIKEMAAHLNNTHVNRHAAIHGAWYSSGSGYSVEHYQQPTRNLKRPVVEHVSTVSLSDIFSVYVRDCEDVLSKLRDIHMTLSEADNGRRQSRPKQLLRAGLSRRSAPSAPRRARGTRPPPVPRAQSAGTAPGRQRRTCETVKAGPEKPAHDAGTMPKVEREQRQGPWLPQQGRGGYDAIREALGGQLIPAS